MSNAVATVHNASAVESALVQNDLGKLTVNERLSYYNAVCESVGLNPMTQPFAFITLNGKITLYAKRDAADQLRKIHGVSIQILTRKTEGDLYVITVKAKDRTGREDEATGLIPITGLKGEALANAMLKCETKAKRRVTLSICGLGILDETEVVTVPGFTPTENPQITNPLKQIDPPEGLTTEDLPENTIDAVEVLNSELGDYVVKIGKKHKGKKLSDFDIKELDSYLSWVNCQAKEKNQELTGDWKEFAENAEAFLQSREFIR